MGEGSERGRVKIGQQCYILLGIDVFIFGYIFTLGFRSMTPSQSNIMPVSMSAVWGYRGGSPTAVQAWQPCPLWELSPSHPILL